MKHELFVEQPCIDLKKGIRVTKDTELTFQSEKAEQTLKDLVLETIMEERGSNGFNSYESKSYIKLQLNEGDVLLFHEERGYYLPKYPMESIEEAIADVESLRGLELEEK